MATTRGIDVSVHQKAQDWNKHKKEGVTFAFAKASEGQNTRDRMFDDHMAGILKAGLIPGAYHFAWPNQDPVREAANYIGAVKPYTSDGFMHWLDLERYSDGRNYKNRTAHEIQQWAARWVQEVRRAFPNNFVGVYTSQDDIRSGRLPDGVALWYPAYPVPSITYAKAEKAAKPDPGVTPLIWQFTSTPIDRSIAYVSPGELRALSKNNKADAKGADAMELQDKVKLGDWVAEKWPDDEGLQDGFVTVNTALGSTYAHARAAREGVDGQADTLDAILAALAQLGKDVTALRTRQESMEKLLKAKE